MNQTLLSEIKSIIEDNLDDHQLTVEKLSRKAAISKPQLYRQLMANGGLSANKLITHLRIVKAKALLRNCNQQVSTIAYQTGFSDPNYFSKVFKKKVGMRPGEFRKFDFGFRPQTNALNGI